MAAFAMAALVATAAIFALKQGQLDAIVSEAICKVTTALNGGSCSSAQQPGTTQQPAFDPKPKKCKINTHTQQVSSEVKIAFIKIGQNAGFIETTYSDGTVTYTATDGAGLGAEGGVGANFDVGKLEAGAKVDFGGGLEFSYGSTWTFKNADEAEALKQQINDYVYNQRMMTSGDPGAAFGAALADVDPPRPPDQSVTTFEAKGDVTGSLGVSLPWEQKSGGDSSSSTGSSSSDDDSKVPNLKLAKAGLKLGLGEKWTQISNHQTGDTTWTTNYEGYAQGEGSLGPLEGQIKGLLGSSLTVTRDKDGKIKTVTLTSTQSGSMKGTTNAGQSDLGGKTKDSTEKGDVNVTTTSLSPTDDQQRTMLEQWLKQGAIATPEMITPSKAVDGDDIQKLFFQQATVSQVDYQQVNDSYGFAAEVKLGVQLGIDFSYSDDKSNAVGATYLDTPDSTGTRNPVDFPECVG